MTKKATKLFAKFEDKMTLEKDLCELGIVDKEKALKAIQYHEKTFDDLVTAMFMYEELSKKDLHELMERKIDLFFKVANAL